MNTLYLLGKKACHNGLINILEDDDAIKVLRHLSLSMQSPKMSELIWQWNLGCYDAIGEKENLESTNPMLIFDTNTEDMEMQ